MDEKQNSLSELFFDNEKDTLKAYAFLIERLPNAVLIVEEDTIVYGNREALALFGADSSEALLSQSFHDLLRPLSTDEISGESAFTRQEQPMVRLDQTRFLAEIDAVRPIESKPKVVIYLIRDITERKTMEIRLQQLANYDVLTDTPNQVLFNDRLDLAIKRAKRLQASLGVLRIDIDDFRLINEMYGYMAGDEVLKVIARRLKSSVRESDTVARLSGSELVARMGGDEFAILLENIHEPRDVAVVVERISQRINKAIFIDHHQVNLTASIGISIYPQNGFLPKVLLQNADTALSQAKKMGKNTYTYYATNMTLEVIHRLSLLSDLRAAMSNDYQDFELYYQPQIDAQTGRVFGVEALLRWQHPKRGMLLPGEFLHLAEESGMIEGLGEWVLREACRQMKAWAEIDAAPPRLAVNLSARQIHQTLSDHHFSEFVKACEIDVSRLTLELNESSFLKDVEGSIRELEALKQLGVKLALDDFGIGFSSLGSLASFPFDLLKIDLFFVQNMLERKENLAVVDAIIAIANTLDLELIAEGVEEREQAQLLLERGCPQQQGWYYSPAVPAAEVPGIISELNSGQA
ncbi:MAG: EAL domain-containing protein [Anaerolineaceae bacterium]|nr:EAL domain-containing protein [Anaerolineaceae bacterium]